MKKLLCLTFLVLLTSTASAQIKYVPDDYTMIQHAINDAKDGDVIIVREGTYCQQINFKGKAIIVASEYYLDGDTSHISRTIIDGIFLNEKDSSSLVYFMNGEDSTSILSGFTLQNGKGLFTKTNKFVCVGGAIFMLRSGATISHNIIKNNHTYNDINVKWNGAWGGGLFCVLLPESKTLIISHNQFSNNSIKSEYWQAMGGGIFLEATYGNVKISNNRIIGNKVESVRSGYGGGICSAGASGDSKIIIENNFIFNNSTYAKLGSTKGGGIACYFSAPIIRNNIIVENETQYPQSISHDAFGGGIAVFWYLDFMDEFPICEDPFSLIAVIENNTIAFNNDKLAGGGVALRYVGARLRNNIIGCNFSKNEAQIKVEYHNLVPETKLRTVKVDYCNVEGGVEGISNFYNGTGNINKFPEFTDEEHWYLKRDLSPCIDAGDPSKEYEDIEDTTCLGRACFPALGTQRNDIGAFGGPHSKWQEMADPVDVDFVIEQLPNQAYLSQNYPNPFNPSTTIKYTIPASTVMLNSFQHLNDSEIPKQVRDDISFVSLKVYDILGREVATLVNEKQKPGNYEVVWNATDYPSGVYFYELRIGASTGLSADKAGSAPSFVETKKLTLLK